MQTDRGAHSLLAWMRAQTSRRDCPFALWHNSLTGKLEVTDTSRSDRRRRWARPEYTLLRLYAKRPEFTPSWVDHILKWPVHRVEELWPFGPSIDEREMMRVAGWHIVRGRVPDRVDSGYLRQLPNGDYERQLTKVAVAVEVTKRVREGLREVAVRFE